MKLLEPYTLGPSELDNRMVMAPMTRGRASEEGVPSPLAPKYYAQRASAGLLVTEATQVSPQGVGYIRTPGIHTASQVEGWRRVTEAVHHVRGRIFLQLWHVGRISHPDFHDGALPVAPSAVPPAGDVHTYSGKKPMTTPRALDAAEIPGIVEQFRLGAARAKEAGFDGVEIHGANGYLLDQFLRDGTNRRDDRYGGSPLNRARLALDVTEAVISVWGADRVGYRISPNSRFNDMSDSNPPETFSTLVRELGSKKLGYLHVVENAAARALPPSVVRLAPRLRTMFDGTFIVNEGYDRDSAEAAIQEGLADLVSFGAQFLANPDLPKRFARGAALNQPNVATFYTGDESGYADYPALSD